MRTVLHVLGMFALGAVALIGVAVLYESRLRQPIPATARLTSPTATGTSGSSGDTTDAPARTAISGLRADLEFFAEALAHGRRSEAMRTLDGAYHVADVLRSSSDRDPVATVVFDTVISVRRAVQNGKESNAVDAARNAAAHLSNASFQPILQLPSRLDEYVAATVISATGDVLGTIRRVARNSVAVERGGHRYLGFIPLHSGPTRDVPVDAVIFGAPRRLGMTLVIDASR